MVAPDLRGFGDSDAPPGGYHKKTVATDLHRLLTGIDLAGHEAADASARHRRAGQPGRPGGRAGPAHSVTGAVVEECGHWLCEEQPAKLAALLLPFLKG
ncbi:hypothetical protein [Micromonospora sp. WMMD980]|uniref:alpha/beta fold hydrolase n=1 Tax=Micromonospora sp. WMMD980 TaxID=3016088 RepID=UPI002415CE51|nr:hypothetical protein [Micromonospora sp. WMMD980]MDG4803515.1 hypothetical protein [Micromonospora sp. WMMD980]